MSIDSPLASPGPYTVPLQHPAPVAQSSSYLGAASSSSRPLLPSRTSAASPIPSYHRHPGCVLCSLIIAAEEFGDAILAPAAPRTSGLAVESPGERSASPSQDSFLAKGKARYSQPHDPYAPPENGGAARVNVHGKEILYQDQEILVYLAEGKERLCNDGRHLVIVPKRHVTGVYELVCSFSPNAEYQGPPDVPLLSHMIEIAHKFLPLYSRDHGRKSEDGRVGFVGNVISA